MADEPTHFDTYGTVPSVEVYSKATGRKQTVPAEWMDHEVLGAPFRKTPLSERQAREAEKSAAAAADPDLPDPVDSYNPEPPAA